MKNLHYPILLFLFFSFLFPIFDVKSNITETYAIQQTPGADELKLGNDAYARKDYKAAFDYYIISESKGNIMATANIGLLYEMGFYVSKNMDIAVNYYDKAIAQGNKFAMVRKGIILAGRKNTTDDIAAFKLFVEAGESSGDAINWLGYMYETGRGTEADFTKALELYKKAFDKYANTYAKEKLESLPKNITSGKAHLVVGDNLKFKGDIEKAKQWYLMAYEKGNADGAYEIGKIYFNKEATDTNKAIPWLEKAAVINNKNAQIDLAIIHFKRKNYTEAFNYRYKAAMNGDLNSINNVGYMYHNGLGVPKNYFEAYKWYKQAADKGFAMGMFNVGVMHHYGEGTTKNLEEAKMWYEKALAAGYDKAKNQLAKLEELIQSELKQTTSTTNASSASGGTPNNKIDRFVNDVNRKGVELYNQGKYLEALPHLLESAGKGDAESYFRLGTMYDFGYGVVRNHDKCIFYYEEAEKLGHDEASEMLDEIYFWGW